TPRHGAHHSIKFAASFTNTPPSSRTGGTDASDMCGIVGELRIDGGQVDSAALTRMTGAIVHRGPDHGAAYCGSGSTAGLGFRRLSIIDLREAANQPIPNEDGSVQLVFNGEIYNFKGIRDGLVERGHQFRSSGDSEVIAHLFEEKGERAID